MSDTPRMDSAFNQPTSTTPRMNWQLDQCYREGCKLERNLAEAQNLLKQCLSAMPVGYIPTHTAENLPEMICDLAKALAEETTERENLERELAAVAEQRDEARAVLVYEQGGIHATAGGWAAKYAEAIEQRDRLAEALKDVMKYRKGEEPYDYWRLPESHRRNVQFDGWNEIENRINAALAAVKGGSDE